VKTNVLDSPFLPISGGCSARAGQWSKCLFYTHLGPGKCDHRHHSPAFLLMGLLARRDAVERIPHLGPPWINVELLRPATAE
jgi:hypothetical protein